MYLTSKNLFVVVYCRIFAPLKRILLRGESPQTIILPQKEKEASRLRQLFLAKKIARTASYWLHTPLTTIF